MINLQGSALILLKDFLETFLSQWHLGMILWLLNSNLGFETIAVYKATFKWTYHLNTTLSVI